MWWHETDLAPAFLWENTKQKLRQVTATPQILRQSGVLHRFKRATGEVHQSLVVPKLERTRKPKVVPSTSSFREVVLGPGMWSYSRWNKTETREKIRWGEGAFRVSIDPQSHLKDIKKLPLWPAYRALVSNVALPHPVTRHYFYFLNTNVLKEFHVVIKRRHNLQMKAGDKRVRGGCETGPMADLRQDRLRKRPGSQGSTFTPTACPPLVCEKIMGRSLALKSTPPFCHHSSISF